MREATLCVLQVVPADKKQAWISGRQTPACGLVENDTLLSVGGYGPVDLTERNMLAHFTYTPGPALALHASLKNQGAHISDNADKGAQPLQLQRCSQQRNVPSSFFKTVSTMTGRSTRYQCILPQPSHLLSYCSSHSATATARSTATATARSTARCSNIRALGGAACSAKQLFGVFLTSNIPGSCSIGLGLSRIFRIWSPNYPRVFTLWEIGSYLSTLFGQK